MLSITLTNVSKCLNKLNTLKFILESNPLLDKCENSLFRINKLKNTTTIFGKEYGMERHGIEAVRNYTKHYNS